jgi:hypothetical protein
MTNYPSISPVLISSTFSNFGTKLNCCIDGEVAKFQTWHPTILSQYSGVVWCTSLGNGMVLRLFHCTLYNQLVFDHTPAKRSVGRSCRAIGSKTLVVVWFTRGFLLGILWGATYNPGHRTFYFCRRGGFGLVVGVVLICERLWVHLLV